MRISRQWNGFAVLVNRGEKVELTRRTILPFSSLDSSHNAKTNCPASQESCSDFECNRS